MDNSVSLGSKYVGLNPVQLHFLDFFLSIPVFIRLSLYISSMDILI